MCACMCFGMAFLGLLCFAILWHFDPPRSSSPPSEAQRVRPVVLVTLGWCALYYCMLQGQAAAAFWVHRQRREAGKRDEALDRQQSNKSISFAEVKYGSARSNTGLILTMDRSVGNMLEQTPPFLLGLWLHALVASAEHAALLGWLWLLLRASYPVAFANPSWSPGLWGVQRIVGISWVSFVTWPSYAVVWMLLIGSWRACMDGGGVSS